MFPPIIYADFNNADTDGRIRLNCTGTIDDISRLGLRLHDGLAIVVHDEELAADGVVAYSSAEAIWTAVIDWNAIRPWPDRSFATNGTGTGAIASVHVAPTT